MGGVRHVKELTDIVVYNVLCVPGPLQTERKLSSSSRIVYCKHPLWQTVFMESCCDTRPCLHSYRGVVSLQSSWWRDVLGHSYFPPGSHGFEQQQERTKGWCTLVPGPSSPLSRGRSHKFSPFHLHLITVIPKWPKNELSMSCKTCLRMNCIADYKCL